MPQITNIAIKVYSLRETSKPRNRKHQICKKNSNIKKKLEGYIKR